MFILIFELRDHRARTFLRASALAYYISSAAEARLDTTVARGARVAFDLAATALIAWRNFGSVGMWNEVFNWTFRRIHDSWWSGTWARRILEVPLRTVRHMVHFMRKISLTCYARSTARSLNKVHLQKWLAVLAVFSVVEFNCLSCSCGGLRQA
jgi:hypothetical protein